MSELTKWSGVNRQQDLIDSQIARSLLQWIFAHDLEKSYSYLNKAKDLLEKHRSDYDNPHRLHMPLLGNRILYDFSLWLRDNKPPKMDLQDKDIYAPDFEELVDLCDNDPLVFFDIFSSIVDPTKLDYPQITNRGYFNHPQLPSAFYSYDPYPYKGETSNTLTVNFDRWYSQTDFVIIVKFKQLFKNTSIKLNNGFTVNAIPTSIDNVYFLSPFARSNYIEKEGYVVSNLQYVTSAIDTDAQLDNLLITIRDSDHQKLSFDDFVEKLVIYPALYNPIDINAALTMISY